MADRSVSTVGFISRKWLVFLFAITSILFLFSWFFVLRPTGNIQLIDVGLQPNSKRDSTTEDSYPVVQNQTDGPSIGSRTILGDDESKETSKPEQKVTRKFDFRSKRDKKQVLKVFMYDLPIEFHFGLLGWKPEGDSIWPNITRQIPAYPGGLNLQHSIEYWLTLDLLASELPNPQHGGSAIRVLNFNEADVIFVPFFSSLSYNRFSKVHPNEKNSRNKVLQDKLVSHLTAQKEWQRSGGTDHLIVAHHPNSMLDARMQLWPATFLLSDFGRYPPTIANVAKDVIAPYKHVIRSYVNDSSTYYSRPILLYFRGAIYRKDGGLARQELFYLLKDEKDVHFAFGSVQKDGIRKASEGMHSSKFCLNIAGDTPSSNRLFDAIASHCVPVIISDDIELPYDDVLDYSEFCIFVPTRDALKEKYLINLIRGMGKDEWTRMWNKLQEVEQFFEFHYPSKEGDAVQMIWQAVARKLPGIKLKLHKSRRFSHPPVHAEEHLKSIPVPRNFW